VLVLAAGSQLIARVLRVPALVVSLPAAFIAGVATGDVHPDNLLGPLYRAEQAKSPISAPTVVPLRRTAERPRTSPARLGASVIAVAADRRR
jgi:hypothetical protein